MLERDVIKCTRTERKFKADFLENKASNEKFLFYIFDFFFRVESPLSACTISYQPPCIRKYTFSNLTKFLIHFNIFSSNLTKLNSQSMYFFN